MNKKKRKNNVFSLSFLDCICCGFGAIILLFIVSMGVKAKEIGELREALERIIQQRLLQVSEFEMQTEELSILLAIETEKRKKVEDDISSLEAMIAELKNQIQDKKFSEDKMLVDLDELKKELAVLQVDIDIEQKQIEPTPVGVPVESNYIAFVIDTSGSMRDSSTGMIWSYVVQKFEETVQSYPEVKGIQLLDADGHFIMGRGMRRKWMDDSPETRNMMVRSVRLYPYESDSNPMPGVVRAIRTLAEPENEEMKMGIYIFGDEFAGRNSDAILNTIDRINKNKDGDRIVRINAIGFPNMIRQALSLSQSGLRFASLMRRLTFDNDGAFVALERQSLMEIEKENRDRYPRLPPRRPTGPSIIFGPGI